MTDIIEIMARATANGLAIFTDEEPITDEEWAARPDEGRAMLDGIATAIITALTEAGYAIVPVEPSKPMLSSGMATAEECLDHDTDSNMDGDRFECTTLRSDAPLQIYRAMIEAGRVKA